MAGCFEYHHRGMRATITLLATGAPGRDAGTSPAASHYEATPGEADLTSRTPARTLPARGRAAAAGGHPPFC